MRSSQRVSHPQSSPLCRQAKVDALSALGAAAEGYGPAAMQPHLSTVWQALRGELLAPAAPGLLPTHTTTAQEVSRRPP